MPTTRLSSWDDPRQARSEVQAYFTALPPKARKALKQVRDAIRAAAPGVVEGFSYRIPAFRLDGKSLVWCAAFKHHVSLYPMTATIKRAHTAELKGHEVSKGTVRFPLDKPVPSALIKRLVKTRVKELRRGG
ncbi:MAG: DUF1801 domain-containing protein [Gemmatimonadota bacterium]|nr:DUF1801 domain-containing protein [Gemmatimonadota bacterium]